jgi:hypothetical protein
MRNFSIRPWITPAPPTIGPKENLKRARTQMRAANVAELLVVDDGKLVGTVSERDIWERCPTSTLWVTNTPRVLDGFGLGVMALHPPVIHQKPPYRGRAGIRRLWPLGLRWLTRAPHRILVSPCAVAMLFEQILQTKRKAQRFVRCIKAL